MKQPVDFEECLKDSPRFRYDIEQNEQDINILENILEKLFKLCNGMVDTGKDFNSSTGALIRGIETLVRYFDDDKLVASTLKKFTSTLTELQTFFRILMDQAQRSIATALHVFVKDEIKKVKETKKVFDKISDDLDNAYMRNAHLPKTCKPTEAEEAKNILTAMHSCFSHTSLDYSFQINILQSNKRIVVLDKLLTFMHAQYSYFSQGYELMRGLDSDMKEVERQVLQLSSEFTTHKKEMEERHTLVQKKEESGLLTKRKENDPSGIVMEGYLFKRSSNAFKSWHRRWFTVKNNQLSYRKRSRDDLTVLADDLRLCQMKNTDDLDRRFCFELVSPTKSWYLQADSDFLRQEWIEAMQACIKKAFSESKENGPDTGRGSPVVAVRKSRSAESIEKIQPEPSSILSLVRSIPGNDRCCDCGHSDPKWASINLGIMLCIECSGIHRSLGVHLSKVRSLTLDAWEPEPLKLMYELGNDLINSIYEANTGTSVKPTMESSRLEKESWIKSKYVQHKFVSLELFLRNFRRLDAKLIKNLAVMKVYHERKRSSSETRTEKVFRRKAAIKGTFRNKGKKEGNKTSSTKINQSFSRKTQKGFAKQDEEYSSGVDSSCDTDARETREPYSAHRVLTKESDIRIPMDSLVSEIISSSRDETLQAMLLNVATVDQQDTNIVDKNTLSPKPPLAQEEEEQDLFSLGSSSKSSFEGLLDDDVMSKSRSESMDSLEQDVLFKRHSVALPVRGTEQALIQEQDDEHLKEEREKAIEVLKHLQPSLLLYKAAEWRNLPLMAAAFAEGAKVNWVNEEDDSKTPLHQSVLGGSLAACEFLMQNGAKVNLRDARGRGALHHAALLGQTGPTCLFLKRGANQHAVDESGEDPLTIALKQTNADIVTLLRIARLNDEMKEGDELMIGMSSDETFANVFRDFSNMASMDPERLKRNFDPDRQSNV